MRRRTGIETFFAVFALIGALLVCAGVLGIVFGAPLPGVLGIVIGSLDLYAGWKVRRSFEQLRSADAGTAPAELEPS